MAIKDEEQIRGWAVEYALRLHPEKEIVTPRRIIREAKQIERYLTGQPSAKILKLAKNDGKK